MGKELIIIIMSIAIVVLIGMEFVSGKITQGMYHKDTLSMEIIACRGSKTNKTLYVQGKVDCMPRKDGTVLLRWGK